MVIDEASSEGGSRAKARKLASNYQNSRLYLKRNHTKVALFLLAPACYGSKLFSSIAISQRQSQQQDIETRI